MNVNEAKKVIDSFEKVERIIQSRPKLGKDILPSYVKLIDVIYQLSIDKDKLKVSDIANYLKQTMPSITRNLKAMEQLNLISKTYNSTDKRNVYIKLTDDGLKIYNKYVSEYYKQLADKLSKLDYNDINTMIETIDKIYNNLQENPIDLRG